MIRRRPRAESDVEEIGDFISLDSIDSAIRFTIAVEDALQLLHESPRIGRARRFRSRRLANLRSWHVPGFTNHLIFYRATADGIHVLRVLHAARDLRAALLENE